MDKSSLSNGHDVRRQKCKNCENIGNNSLLRSFIEYVWDENAGEYSECKADELTRWLIAETDIICFCTTGSDDVKSNDNVLCKTRESIDRRMCAELAFKLKKVLPILIASNEDVNYTNDDGQTFLHIFIEKILKGQEKLSQYQIYKLQKLTYHLIEIKAPFFTSDEHDDSPLHIAKSCINREIPKIIISSLIDLDACVGFENTALRFVVENCVDYEGHCQDDYVDFAKIFITKGANANARNVDGVTAVHLAAEKFQVPMLQLFAGVGANFDEYTDDHETPLHFASKSRLDLKDSPKAVETIDFLVSQGCDVEAVNVDGWTPLHLAAHCQSVQIVQRLIALGVKVDCRTKVMQLTPLYLAAKGDKLDNMKALVKAGADVNAEAVDGSTPIFMSVMLGSCESMQFLIDQGADLHRRDRAMGFTLLHVAAYDDVESPSKLAALIENEGLDVNDAATCGISPLQLAALRQNLKHVEMLVSRGADVDFRGEESEFTALHLAAMWSHLDIMKVLLENGADVDRRGGVDRIAPLHMVLAAEVDLRLGKVRRFSEDVSYLQTCWPQTSRAFSTWTFGLDRLVALLLEHGADVNVKDATGRTPLHLVTRHPYMPVMRMLLKAGADVNLQDEEGRLPVHDACEGKYASAFDLLLEFGADINDDDTSEMILNSIIDFRRMAAQHLAKLKLVGLPVSAAYEELVGSRKFADSLERSWFAREAVELATSRDEDGFSLHKFLRMSPRLQYRSIRRICCENVKKQFPMYAGLILRACRECENRRSLLELAEVAWTRMFGALLPDLCMDKIFGFLSNRYLEAFVAGANDVEKVFVNEGVESLIIGCIENIYSN